MQHVLALDQGTTSSRAIVFDSTGGIVAVSQREFKQSYPRPGWVEHDAKEIWQTQRAVALEAVAQAKIPMAKLAAIGLTNQRETIVVWNRQTGEPIGPAIVWQDRRTAEFCDELRAAGHEPWIRRKTGLVVDAYFSASKLKWILDQIPHAREQAEAGKLAAGTIDAWLVWHLTGGAHHVTDASNASRTMLFNLQTGDWDDDLLALFRIPRALLPRIVGSQEIVGEGTGDFAGVPLGGIAGDQQAALFGQMCHRPGMVKNTYGTGCFLLHHTGEKPVVSKHKLLTTVAWKRAGRTEYALEGSVFIAGAAVQWLRDGLGIIRSSSEVEGLAASVPDNGGVYFVPALSGLGAPYWDPYARGAIVGLTRGSTAAHLARATLESLAHQTADLLHAIQQDSEVPLRELRVDGGASANNLLMQLQADLLGAPVVRPKILESTAMGAAFLAGLAVGVWRNVEELVAIWQIDRTFLPQMTTAERDARRSRWHRAVERARAWEDPK